MHKNRVMASTDVSRLTGVERGELVLETGLIYDGVTPVRIRATKREGRFEFSDGGGAVAAAGVDPKGLDFPDRIGIDEYEVNVSRRGVVWLPGFARSKHQWLAQLPGLVARGSVALYEALLELEE
jgi:hypothetical protein